MRKLRSVDFLTINTYWLGINIASGIITPLLLPKLIELFVPGAEKNTYLGNLRVITLAVAMFVQPVAGMLSDRNTSRWGRRRPYIFFGAIFNLLFLTIIGVSTIVQNSPQDPTDLEFAAYMTLLVGISLLQVSSNTGQAALQALLPDIVPEDQRGRASGVKAVFELLPIFVAILIGGILDQGRYWLTIGIIMAGFLITMAITVGFVQEEPLTEKPQQEARGTVRRTFLLTFIFVAATQVAVWLVKRAADWVDRLSFDINLQILSVGLIGLIGMAGAIFIGVYYGARVGIGKEARQNNSFIWWVINRLLYLAAMGSIQGFALFYLIDCIGVPSDKAGTLTSLLLAVVAVFLIPAALVGGYLADRVPRRRLVGLAGLISAVGTLVILLATESPWIISIASGLPEINIMLMIAGAILGLGAGLFLATNWALGTDLAPPEKVGRYLGISNMAGAGAGIIGAGIGGPMADMINQLIPCLGYKVIYAIYGSLFMLSVATLVRVKPRVSDR